ncbi:MAG: ATP-binding protein [Nitrososphaerota archaeon]|jgi:predicted AAA+ superfamily ATPase|nr:ATP-binding protein [Nitrososphaerota archaeon]
MEFSELAQKNPWWKDKNLIMQDRNIKQFQQSNIQWTPRIKHKFTFNQDIIYTLRGPRQVGKTTLTKTIIKELLETNIPEQIFFYACDLVNSPKELAEILECYIKGTRKILPNQRLFLFIDEISSVNKWQKGVKAIVDQGLLENCTVILTGSHSIDIKKASERLPGRQGNTPNQVVDKIFLPMKFAEYVETQNPKIKSIIKDELNLLKAKNRLNLILNLLENPDIPSQIEKLNYYNDELTDLFHRYLLTGGIVTALDAYLSQKVIPVNVYETHIKAILGDVAHFQKKANYVAQIIQQISKSLAGPVSWQSIYKQTDLGSHNTVAEYVEFLEASFTVSTIYQLDREKNSPMFKKQKKVYFNDPFIFHVLNSWAFSQPPFESAESYVEKSESCSKLVESIVCDHLKRLCFSWFPSSNYVNSAYYWRDSSGREVDFVVKLEDKYLPVEVKYQNIINRSDTHALHTFMRGGRSHRGLVVTKNSLQAGKDIVQIPCYLLLMLI